MRLYHLLEVVTEENKLDEALFWVERWISGSMNDPDWDDSWTTMSVDDAFRFMAQYIGASVYKKYPVLWRFMILPSKDATKLKRSKLLPATSDRSFRSFTVSKDLAIELCEDIDPFKARSEGNKIVIISAKVPSDRILFGINDLKRPKKDNQTHDTYRGLADWHYQQEVFVDTSQPLQLEDVIVLKEC